MTNQEIRQGLMELARTGRLTWEQRVLIGYAIGALAPASPSPGAELSRDQVEALMDSSGWPRSMLSSIVKAKLHEFAGAVIVAARAAGKGDAS